MVTSRTLMGDVGATESEAFLALLDPVLPDAYRLAYGLLHHAEDAAAAVQESTIAAWRHRRSFRAGSPMRPWFLAVVANQCRRTLGARHRRVVSDSGLAGAVPDSDPAQVDQTLEFRRAVSRLRERDRLVLILCYYLDLPFDEVAATAGISPGAARVRVHRAVTRLKKLLGDEELV